MSNFRLKSRILEIIVVVATMAIVASSHAQSANIGNQLGVSEGLSENFIKEIHSAQSVADALRDQSGAELALVASGQIQTANSGVPLITSLLFQDESVWVVQLTGKQLREAFEKSAAFFPNSMSSFLHISGVDIMFSPAKPSFDRIVSIYIGGRSIDSEKVYKVAMTSTLAHGALGYSSIWNFREPSREIGSLEKLLQGKTVQSTGFRWSYNSLR